MDKIFFYSENAKENTVINIRQCVGFKKIESHAPKKPSIYFEMNGGHSFSFYYENIDQRDDEFEKLKTYAVDLSAKWKGNAFF